jgi:hypothetical protein
MTRQRCAAAHRQPLYSAIDPVCPHVYRNDQGEGSRRPDLKRRIQQRESRIAGGERWRGRSGRPPSRAAGDGNRGRVVRWVARTGNLAELAGRESIGAHEGVRARASSGRVQSLEELAQRDEYFYAITMFSYVAEKSAQGTPESIKASMVTQSLTHTDEVNRGDSHAEPGD